MVFRPYLEQRDLARLRTTVMAERQTCPRSTGDAAGCRVCAARRKRVILTIAAVGSITISASSPSSSRRPGARADGRLAAEGASRPIPRRVKQLSAARLLDGIDNVMATWAPVHALPATGPAVADISFAQFVVLAKSMDDRERLRLADRHGEPAVPQFAPGSPA